MRFFLAFALAAVVATANADRLIFIPTARKINQGTVRFDAYRSLTEPRFSRTYLGTGVGIAFDAELILADGLNDANALSANFSYNYLNAVPDLVPGLSIGIRDIANRTEEGRAVYIASTYRFAVDLTTSSEAPAEFTIGFGTYPIRGVFTGVMLPLTNGFRLLAEHDSLRFTAGFEVLPLPNLSLRLLYQERRSLVGLSWAVRF